MDVPLKRGVQAVEINEYKTACEEKIQNWQEKIKKWTPASKETKKQLRGWIFAT